PSTVRSSTKLPIFVLFALLLFAPSRSQATFVDFESGSLNTGTGGGIFTMGGGWGGGAFELAWDIDFDSATSEYRYVYTISNPRDAVPPIGQLLASLVHWLLEVSSSFFSADLLDGTIPDTGPTIFAMQGLNAPG